VSQKESLPVTPRVLTERDKAIKRQRDRQEISAHRQRQGDLDAEYREKRRELDREYGWEGDRLLEETQERISVRERSLYGPRSRYSFFRDFVTVQLADERRARARMDPGLRGRDPGDPLALGLQVNPAFGGAEESRRRLASVERRDVTTSDPGALGFIPQDAPSFVGDAYAGAARAQATVAAALRVEPLPEDGMDVSIPVFTTGLSAGVQATENTAVTEEENVDAEDKSAAVRTIAGQVVESRQAFERAGGAWDVALAAELGRAVGTVLETQLLTGSGASGQLLGLINVTGNVDVAFATGTTTQSHVSKIWEGYNQLADPAVGFGIADPAAYLVIVHTRRFAFLNAGAGSTDAPVKPNVPGVLVPSASVRTNVGTNQDEIFVLVRDEVPLYLGPVRITAHEGGDVSGTGQVRVVSYMYASFQSGRVTRAQAHITGAALTAPTL
jgi:HK97 family phage major capsid protein